MSVAFVKEPNEDQVEVLPDREIGTEANLVTSRGLALINATIAELEAKLDPARAAGDKIAVATINRDLRYWTARHATAELVVPDEEAETVQFGSRVEIERENGQRQTYRIVGIDEADPAHGRISYLSPLARNLVGKAIGEEVSAGATVGKIVAISAEPEAPDAVEDDQPDVSR